MSAARVAFWVLCVGVGLCAGMTVFARTGTDLLLCLVGTLGTLMFAAEVWLDGILAQDA